MKKLALVAAVLALAVASPVLACDHAKAGQTAQCPLMMKGVDRTATNLDNGVTILLTSADAAKVKDLQEKIAAETKAEGGCDCPMHAKNVKTNVENTATGVKLTLTSDDKEQVKTLQAFAAKNCKGNCPMHGTGAKA